MKLKTKEANDYHYTAGNKKCYMQVFICKRPCEALWITHRGSFHKVVKVILNYGGAGYKKIKADIVKGRMKEQACFYT